MSDAQLLDATFTITDVNSAKYDRVSRIKGDGDGLIFSLDINHDLYPIAEKDTVQLVLASTLNLDGTEDGAEDDNTKAPAATGAGRGGQQAAWRDQLDGRDEMTLADGFDYVCFGKVYRFEEGKDKETGKDQIQVYASFGGLLLWIKGPHKRLSNLRIDDIYLLLKK